MNSKMTAADAASFLGVTLQAIHKQLKTKKLGFRKSQNRVYFGHATAKEIFKLKFKPRTVSIQIVKGGTGKTTLTHSIATRANLYGAKVLCIDLDQQGNLTQAFGINPEDSPVMVDILNNEEFDLLDAIKEVDEGLHLIPSRIENAVLDNTLMLNRCALDRIYRDLIKKVKKHYDLILIDCPPALGQSVAAAALASDAVISPLIPEKFCLSGLKITAQELMTIGKSYNKKISHKILLNKFDSRTNLSHDVLTMLIKHPTYGQQLYKSYVRTSQEFPNVTASEEAGISIYDTLKNTSPKEDVDLLTREILGINKHKKQEKVSLGTLEDATA
ncbi:ParA family protein [Piscirickettsia litoralis]|uniref:AAA domain-containing protein n=1 Tax=Piscirickettsia litoralis TaxID=1891921 RepID=A0ABX2ZXT2_9GAMM|nr:ParA family protein [Piscirickettsia litoralis]ODN41293.1 hypothetical protein BGC07_17165 [Piscirickettsia litoralis]